MRKLHLAVLLTLIAPAAFAAEADLPSVEVFKSPTCGCCEEWVNYIRKEGFTVTTQDVEDMSVVKNDTHVLEELQSCHTAKVGNYVIEGHVPAADIRRLLTEKPDATGLAVAGMPASSPGMDVPGSTDAYDVILFKADGHKEVYSHHGE